MTVDTENEYGGGLKQVSAQKCVELCRGVSL